MGKIPGKCIEIDFMASIFCIIMFEVYFVNCCIRFRYTFTSDKGCFKRNEATISLVQYTYIYNPLNKYICTYTLQK